MKQKTAIDWLREQYHKTPQSQFGNLFEQAKKLEREQIEEAYKNGQNDVECGYRGEKEKEFTPEQYYQQKYGDEPTIKND